MNTPAPIEQVAAACGIPTQTLESYGRYTAKVPLTQGVGPAPLVMVTAVTPTPLGEGKTTTAIGLTQALARLGRRPVLTLRQPSQGPTFGVKGGAAGAGASQVIPAELLNLHLTGDFHAVTAAHNLLAAMLDNHLYHGNPLRIAPHTVTWPRVLDVNDRALRHVIIGLGGAKDGVPRQASFEITAASELMALLSLTRDIADLRARLGRIVVADDDSGRPVTAADLQADGAMAALLAEAVKPNLMQTGEGQPVLVHTGPFGNIATGNSSVVADLVASQLGDIVVTESGFGADLGAERLVNVKSRASHYPPHAAVVVVTVRALKALSGRYRLAPGRPLPDELVQENVADVVAGLPNLARHLATVAHWGLPAVVAINAFGQDHASEHAAISDFCAHAGVPCAVTTHVADGGAGAQDLAALVLDAVTQPSQLRRDYELDEPIVDKLRAVARGVYGAADVAVAPDAQRALERFEQLGYGTLPVVIAKTHLSLTHDRAVSADQPWTLPIREVRLAAGAGYVYALAGAISTMPGLPTRPNAQRIDVVDGRPVGLT